MKPLDICLGTFKRTDRVAGSSKDILFTYEEFIFNYDLITGVQLVFLYIIFLKSNIKSLEFI